MFPGKVALPLQQTCLPCGICISWKLLALWIDRAGDSACSASPYFLPQFSWTLVKLHYETQTRKRAQFRMSFFYFCSLNHTLLCVNHHSSRVCTSSDAPAGSWASSIPTAAAIATTNTNQLALTLLVFLQCRNRQWTHGVVQKYYWFPELALCSLLGSIPFLDNFPVK